MRLVPIAETTIDSFFSTIANHPVMFKKHRNVFLICNIQTLTTLNMRHTLTSIDDLDHFGDILRNNMVNCIYRYFFYYTLLSIHIEIDDIVLRKKCHW